MCISKMKFVGVVLTSVLSAVVGQSLADSCKTCRGSDCMVDNVFQLDCTKFVPALPFESQLISYEVGEHSEYGCLELEYYIGFAAICRTCRNTGCHQEKDVEFRECTKFSSMLPFEAYPVLPKRKESLQYGCLKLEYSYDGKSIETIQKCIITENLRTFCQDIAKSVSYKRCQVGPATGLDIWTATDTLPSQHNIQLDIDIDNSENDNARDNLEKVHEHDELAHSPNNIQFVNHEIIPVPIGDEIISFTETIIDGSYEEVTDPRDLFSEPTVETVFQNDIAVLQGNENYQTTKQPGISEGTTPDYLEDELKTDSLTANNYPGNETQLPHTTASSSEEPDDSFQTTTNSYFEAGNSVTDTLPNIQFNSTVLATDYYDSTTRSNTEMDEVISVEEITTIDRAVTEKTTTNNLEYNSSEMNSTVTESIITKMYHDITTISQLYDRTTATSFWDSSSIKDVEYPEEAAPESIDNLYFTTTLSQKQDGPVDSEDNLGPHPSTIHKDRDLEDSTPSASSTNIPTSGLDSEKITSTFTKEPINVTPTAVPEAGITQPNSPSHTTEDSSTFDGDEECKSAANVECSFYSCIFLFIVILCVVV